MLSFYEILIIIKFNLNFTALNINQIMRNKY